jgi:hypothetical protein
MRVRGGWDRIISNAGSEFSNAELELGSCVQSKEWKRERRGTSVSMPLIV